MKLKLTLIAGMAIVALAALALSAQVQLNGGTATKIGPNELKGGLENIVAKNINGTWKVNGEITRRLTPVPDPVLMKWGKTVFTSDTKTPVMERMKKEIERLNITEIFAGGYLTKGEGADNVQVPYLLYNRGGNVRLIWWETAKDGAGLVPDARFVNLVQGADAAKDLLFMGTYDGTRGASICFERVP